MKEIWKEFHRTDGKSHKRAYEISNKGRARSINVHPYAIDTDPRELKLVNGGFKGQYIKVACGRELGYQYVHILVLEAFKSKRPEYLQANHIDLDTTNNYVDNLEWVTASRNTQHMQDAYGGVNQYTKHRSKEQAQIYIRRVNE